MAAIIVVGASDVALSRKHRAATEQLGQRSENPRRAEIRSMAPRQFDHRLGLAFALLTSWIEHLRARAIVPEARREPTVERVIRLLRDENRSSLDDLSRASGTSRSVLTRLFKRQTGLSILEYKNRLRVERFLALYADGEKMTLLDAALAAGFGSYAQFHRVFRDVIGHTPSRLTRPKKKRAT